MQGTSLTLNISSRKDCSTNTLFRLVSEETLYRLLPECLDERSGETKYVEQDNTSAKHRLVWELQTTVVEGLRQTIVSINRDLGVAELWVNVAHRKLMNDDRIDHDSHLP